MDFHTLIERMDANTCEALQRAIETGKFPDGRRLTDDQRALCMEAVLAWQIRNLPPERRIGYIDRSTRAKGAVCVSDDHLHDEQPLHIKDKH